MPVTHKVIRQLLKEVKLEIIQKGSIVNDVSKMKGPYRIRKRRDK